MQKSATMQNRSLQIRFPGSRPCKPSPAWGHSLSSQALNPGLPSLPATVVVVGTVGLTGAALVYGVPANIKVSDLLPMLFAILK